MRTVTVNGKSLSYEINPKDADPGALTAVFIHGSGGDLTDWEAQLESLTDAATIVALDLPGHGQSDGPTQTSVEAFADRVMKFVGAPGLSKVVIVGCSLGSAIAQTIALARPPWLVGLGLVGAGSRLKVHPAFLQGLAEDPDDAINKLADFALAVEPDPAVKESVLNKFRSVSPDLIRTDLVACNEFDVSDRLHEISVPTWILVGSDDRLTPVKYATFLHENITDSAMDVIPAAGHLAMIEKPEEFNGRFRNFLSEKIGRRH